MATDGGLYFLTATHQDAEHLSHMSESLKESAQFPGAHPAPEPANEAQRIRALHELSLLDTLPELAFDDIVQIASSVCGVPIALVSLVDTDRQWFKARVGLDATETHRDLAFCAHALNTPEDVFEIPDATADVRFATNPLVTGELGIRFYAGMPLVTPDGEALGTLCVIDRQPRKLSTAQAEALRALGRRVMSELELRRTVDRLTAAQAMLEQRRAITESIIDSMPSAVVVVDMEARPLVNNREAQAISGMASEEFPADPADWPSFYGIRELDGRLLPLAEVPIVRAMRGETVRRRDLLIRNERRPAGTVVETNARPVIDAEGRQIGATAVFTDISERQQAAATLAASEHRYRTLVDNMPVMVYRASPQPPWTVQYASPACEKITGYPPAHFVDHGASWADIMFEEDVARVVREVAEANDKGRSDVRVEYRIRHRDGSIRWVADYDRLAADGSALEGVMLDITERKRAEAALHENSRQLEYFKMIAEGTEDFVALSGLDRRVNYINPAGRKALGLASIEAVQATELFDYVFPQDRAKAETEWLPALVREGHLAVEIDMRHFVTGEKVPVLWRAFRLDDPVTGEPYAIAAMGPFLTERRRLEAEREAASQALAASEARFRLITNVAPQIIWTATADGAIDYVNQSGLTYFGRRLDQLTGEQWLALVHPDDVAGTVERWSAALASGRPIEVQYRIRRHDGCYRWHITRGVAELDVQNRQQRWYGVVTDIEDLKQAQAAAEHANTALVRSESSYRFLSEAIPMQVWTADAEGQIDYINGFASRYLGSTQQEIVDHGWIDRVHLDDREPTARRWLESVGSLRPYDAEFRLRRHDGVYRWMLARAVVQLGEDGKVEKWYGTTVEIEDIKQAQTAADQLNQALSRSESHYRFLSEAIPLQVWTARPDGRLDYLNRYAADYLGRSTEDLLRAGWKTLLHPDDAEAALQRWQQSVDSGEPYEAEYRMLRADGRYCWNLSRGLALKNAGGAVEKWFGSTVEIEDIKRAQQLAEDATRAKSAFLSSMSHEIRTPMNAVIGMTSILLDSDLSPGQRESAEIIRTSGDHLLTIINDILDYSKIEAGRLELERSAFSLRECVEGALDLVAGSASTQGVELGYLMEAGTPESVLGDVGRLRQILLNLLSNAVKFSSSGGEVMVQVKGEQAGDGHHRITFSVSDSGLGIDAEVLPHLFQPFVQADASTTRRFGGTGLGLSICRRLAEAMGGGIRVESTPGRGSVFTFDILVEPTAATGRYSPPSSLPQLVGRRVLIVDDIEINRRILIHYVSSWGMVPHAVGAPREALAWLQRGDRFDLALYDYHMPEMDGMELARRTRMLAPTLPIVILSSVSLETHDAAMVSAAMLKPIKPARLLESVAALMSGRVNAVAAGPPPEMERELGHEHPLRLLVVEDNPVNQRVARLLLQRMGYLADFAGDGAEALGSIARQVYDVVLMDVQMPVMDGLTATRELCRRYPPGQRPRIIGMTANATEEDRRNCALAGMDDYLAKPVRPRELAAALRASPRREVGAEAEEDYSAEGLAELQRVYGDDGTEEIIAALIGDMQSQERELQSSLDSSDVVVLQRVAHTLKSNSRLVGATALGEHWEEVERLARTAAPAVAGRLALALLGRYGRLVHRIRREAEGRPG